jgi:hypothetical protein
MNRTLLALLFTLASIGLPVHAADDSLVGTYNGHLITLNGYQVGVKITITSVDGNNVKGSTVHYGNVCNTPAPIEGTVVGRKVSLRSPAVPDCFERKFDLQRDGNKFSGKMINKVGEFEYEVSR